MELATRLFDGTPNPIIIVSEHNCRVRFSCHKTCENIALIIEHRFRGIWNTQVRLRPSASQTNLTVDGDYNASTITQIDVFIFIWLSVIL